ncbi:hypothetical protein DENSPDRAFT_343024 [Dentipellis sp. KUC8613]|nr:hypothetical protein DENSPDRAFT_343024 [Dentipellis sp. KUC8613]
MYSQDKWINKLIVAVLWMLDTVHSILIAYGVYICLVSALNTSLVAMFLGPMPRSLVTTLLLTIINDTIVRFFYWMRIWKLSKGNKVITGSIAILNLSPIGTGAYYLVKLYKATALIDVLKVQAPVYPLLGSACAADWCISIVMSILLWRMQTSIKETKTLINTLILFALSTGLIPSVFAIVILVLFATQQGLVWLGLYFIFNKCKSWHFIDH